MKLMQLMDELGFRIGSLGHWAYENTYNLEPYDISLVADHKVSRGDRVSNILFMGIWVMWENVSHDNEYDINAVSQQIDQLSNEINSAWSDFSPFFERIFTGSSEAKQDVIEYVKEAFRGLDFVRRFVKSHNAYLKTDPPIASPTTTVPQESAPASPAPSAPTSLYELGGCPDCNARKTGPILTHNIGCPRTERKRSIWKARRMIRSRNMETKV